MKILLVNPPQSDIYGKIGNIDYPPISLAYLGAVLENEGHKVKIIDVDMEGLTEEEFINFAKKYDIVAFTSTTPTFKSAEKLCEIVKKNTNAFTVVGGVSVSLSPHLAKSPNIDFIIRGEGEDTMLELVSALGGNKKFDKIQGLSYKKAKKIIHNPNREKIRDIDSLPFPAWHLFNKLSYSYPDSLMHPVMPIMSSRGCPYMCTFCVSPQMHNRRVRFRSAKNVVDEIIMLKEKYGVKEIHFWDDNFILNKKRVFEIRDLIKKNKIDILFAFPNGVRVNHIDEKMLKALKDMKVYSLAFGVESGNQSILDRSKKGTKLKQIEKVFKLSKKFGFETWAFFVLGLPGETKRTIRNSINFAKKLDADVVKFHILKPFPGTEVYNELKRDGLIIEDDFSKYGFHTKPVHRLPDLSEDDLMEMVRLAYREYYLRPSIIGRHIFRSLKSWHRLRLNIKTGVGLIKSMM